MVVVGGGDRADDPDRCLAYPFGARSAGEELNWGRMSAGNAMVKQMGQARRKVAFLAISTVGLIAGLAAVDLVALRLLRPEDAGGEGMVVVDPPVVNVGQTIYGAILKQVFTLRNASKSELVVVDVIRSCTCIGEIGVSAHTIPSGETIQIDVALKVVAREGGHFAQSVDILVKDEAGVEETVRLGFHGTVSRAPYFLPGMIVLREETPSRDSSSEPVLVRLYAPPSYGDLEDVECDLPNVVINGWEEVQAQEDLDRHFVIPVFATWVDGSRRKRMGEIRCRLSRLDEWFYVAVRCDPITQ